jgi:hypothetical protein
LIVKLASSPDPGKSEIKKPDRGIAENRILKTGDSPYTEYFGNQQYNTNDGKNLVIKNNSGLDIIICIFTERGFLRSCFVKNGFYVEIPQLPEKNIFLRYIEGLNWDSGFELKEVKLYGAFTKALNYYKSLMPAELGPAAEITLVNGLNEGFKRINEKDFFSKE